MYSVNKLKDPKYGNVISITIDDSGEFDLPFLAIEKLRQIKRLWKEETPKLKIRYLIDGQIMTLDQAKHWANDEYRELPKCENCAAILKENVFTHALCKKDLFCSQNCADTNYKYLIDELEDEEDYECL